MFFRPGPSWTRTELSFFHSIFIKKMKKFLLLFAVTLSVTFSISAQTHVDSLLTALHNTSKPDYIFVIAHRADWRNAPENSIEGVQRAIKMGVDMVEIDIKKTLDGEFVLMHDHSIDRTTTGKGLVRELTLEQIKNVRLKAGHDIKTYCKVPTLRELLLACKDRVLINIDGGGDYIDEIRPMLYETGTERQVLIKGSAPAEDVRAKFGGDNNLLYMPIIDLGNKQKVAQITDHRKILKPIAYEMCFSKEKQVDMKLFKTLMKDGSRIWINTLWDSLCAGHDDEMAELNADENWGYVLGLGATMIQTDRPHDLIMYLKAKGLRKL